MRKAMLWRAVLVALLVLGLFSGGVFAAAVEPTYLEVSQAPEFPPCEALKIDPPVTGTYHFAGGVWITITVYNTDDGQEFDWSSNAGFGKVFVKGGPGGNLYSYDPMVSSDTGLHAPLNPSGKWADLSNITFYYCFVATPAIDIEKATNGEDADNPTGPMILVGDPVTWTYVVTNTGNVPLTDIAVSDSVMGVTPVYVSGDDGDNILQPGEVWYYEATGFATAGQYSNLGTVTGKHGPAVTVTDTDPSHYFGAAPAIDIEKATNGHDADLPTGPMILAGQPVTWTYVVTNTGNVPLMNISVTDDQGVVVSLPKTTLAVGESMTGTATGVASAGQYANVGTVVGWWEAHQVSDSDPSHYFGAAPAIDIEKHTNGHDADEPTGPVIPVGEAVNWTYIITNTGNVPLTGIEVTDDQGVVVSLPKTTLAVGETMTGTASGVAVAGQYANLGTVVGWWEGNQVSDTDPSHYFGEERTPECFSETAWAAQGSPGTHRFTDNNWATYVIHTKGAAGVTEYPLYAGQTYLAGKIQVWEADGYLHVKYVIEGSAYKPGWDGEWTKITEAHVAVGPTAKSIPSNKGGPIPGRFPYKWYGEDSMATVMIPLSKVPAGEFVIAAHAVVWWCGFPGDELPTVGIMAAQTVETTLDSSGPRAGLIEAQANVSGNPGKAAEVIETLLAGEKPGKAAEAPRKGK